MKCLLIFFIRIYQVMPLASHTLCRHTPSCSEYMIEALETYGVCKGLWLGVKRILKCRPNGTFGYDPVLRKEEKINEKSILD